MSLNNELVDDEYEYYIKCNNIITNIIVNKTCILIDINDIKIGDNIYINFIPDSQKYIYELYSKCGSVESIEIKNQINPYTDKNENYYKIIIKNSSDNLEELFHEGVSYLGTSLGYSYFIYLIK